jgi:CBS domain-containing protein
MQESRLLGLITLREVRAVDAQAWPHTSVGEVMQSGTKIHTVSCNMPLAEALEIMAREDINQLPVVSNGIVEGVVTRAHILQVVRSRAELRLPSLPKAA